MHPLKLLARLVNKQTKPLAACPLTTSEEKAPGNPGYKLVGHPNYFIVVNTLGAAGYRPLFCRYLFIVHERSMHYYFRKPIQYGKIPILRIACHEPVRKMGCCTLTPLVGSPATLRRQLVILHGTLGLVGKNPPPEDALRPILRKLHPGQGAPTLSLYGRVFRCLYYFLPQGIQITTNNGGPLEGPVRAAFTASSGGPQATPPPFFFA